MMVVSSVCFVIGRCLQIVMDLANLLDEYLMSPSTNKQFVIVALVVRWYYKLTFSSHYYFDSYRLADLPNLI